jgi:hypothetical protein
VISKSLLQTLVHEVVLPYHHHAVAGRLVGVVFRLLLVVVGQTLDKSLLLGPQVIDGGLLLVDRFVDEAHHVGDVASKDVLLGLAAVIVAAQSGVIGKHLVHQIGVILDGRDDIREVQATQLAITNLIVILVLFTVEVIVHELGGWLPVLSTQGVRPRLAVELLAAAEEQQFVHGLHVGETHPVLDRILADVFQITEDVLEQLRQHATGEEVVAIEILFGVERLARVDREENVPLGFQRHPLILHGGHDTVQEGLLEAETVVALLDILPRHPPLLLLAGAVGEGHMDSESIRHKISQGSDSLSPVHGVVGVAVGVLIFFAKVDVSQRHEPGEARRHEQPLIFERPRIVTLVRRLHIDAVVLDILVVEPVDVQGDGLVLRSAHFGAIEQQRHMHRDHGGLNLRVHLRLRRHNRCSHNHSLLSWVAGRHSHLTTKQPKK